MDKIKICGIWDSNRQKYIFCDWAPKECSYDIFEVELPNGFEYIGNNCKGEQLIDVFDAFGDRCTFRVDDIFVISAVPMVFNPMLIADKPKRVNYKKINDTMLYDAIYL